MSIDPKRVWLAAASDAPDRATALQMPEGGPVGPGGERWCWYQCTVKGGREARDTDAVELAKASQVSSFVGRGGRRCVLPSPRPPAHPAPPPQTLGAGEIMLNCIDMDGQKQGFDLVLVEAVASAVRIPIIASSGAGCAAHFSDVFEKTSAQAALAAGMFHRNEVSIGEVKAHLGATGVPVRG